MAKFKIYLLTSDTNQSDIGAVSYLRTPISEFYSKEQLDFSTESQFNFCFTFNEKLSLHTNGQKELKFSMLQKLWLDDVWTLNPFINSLKNGAQLLLIDKYDNEMLFTIKNIGYTFKKDNVVYNFTCQDSFTYQTIRLNDGYTIENNANSEDFIGAKSIDWWVLNYIKPDCQLTYDYVPLFQGLYLTEDGVLETYLEDSELTRVKKIIKPIYTKETHREFFETIPFSISGGNCSNALLNIASMLGMSLNYKEHHCDNTSNKIVRYFWFEPTKHEEVSNLEYSPFNSIQSFGLTQGGDSLTTVLNVESNTIDDELISLIPDVPQFFYDVFFSPGWTTSSYSNGFFSSLCQGKTLRATDDGLTNIDFTFPTNVQDSFPQTSSAASTFDSENGFLYIPIFNINSQFLKTPLYYNKIDFEDGDEESYIYVNKVRCTSRSHLWEIVEKTANGFVVYNNTSNTIPLEKQNTNIKLYLRISIESKDPITSVENCLLLLHFYRDYTEEELSFAELADKCPWLENKLINFSYFYQEGIITQKEYEQLLSIIQNDLRVCNGRLLLYSKQYYESLRLKTKLLSQITNDLDSLGAAFNSDVVNAFAVDGAIKDYTYFQNAYISMLSNYYKTPKIESILNYDELVTDYFNKYFKAQQRFLKNLYQFKQFFYQPSSYGSYSKLYRQTITLTPPTNTTERYISFKQYNMKLITDDFNLYNQTSLKPSVDIFTSKQEKVNIVTKQNVGDFYIPLIEQGSMQPARRYNPKKTYYRRLYKIKKEYLSDETTTGYYGDNYLAISMVKHHTDENYTYYGFSSTDESAWALLIKNGVLSTLSVKIGNEFKTLEEHFHPIGLVEIISEYLYRRRFSNQIGGWYYHDADTSQSVSKWLSRKEEENWSWIDSTKSSAWRTLFSVTDELSERWKDFWSEKIIKDFKSIAKDFYVEKFPVTEVSFKGPRYKESEWTWWSAEGTDYKFYYQRANKKNETMSEYIDYWTRTQNGEELLEVKNPFHYTEVYKIPLVTPENEANYFRKVIKSPFWGYALGALAATTGFALALKDTLNPLKAGGFGVGVYEIVSNAVWDASGTIWDTKGHNRFNTEGESYGTSYQGYLDWGDDKRNGANNLNYLTSENAYTAYQDYKFFRAQDFVGSIVEKTNTTNSASYRNEPLNDSGEIINTYTTLAQVGKKELISTNSKIHKDYFDYYQLFGFTYSDIRKQQDDRITYMDDFIRPLLLTEKINLKHTYSMLIQRIKKSLLSPTQLIFDKDDFDFKTLCENKNINPGLKNRISKIIYHPIAANLIPINFNALPLTENDPDNMTLQDALTKAKYRIQSQNGYWIHAKDDNDNEVLFAVFQEEPFVRKNIISTSDFDIITNRPLPSKRYSLYSGGTIYDDLQSTVVNLTTTHDIITGFYEMADSDSAFVRVKDVLGTPKLPTIYWEKENENSPSLTEFYQKTTNNEYLRAYSIIQIKNGLDSCYYLESMTHSVEGFEANSAIKTTVFLHDDVYEDGKLIKANVVEYPELVTFKANTVKTKNVINYKGKDYNYEYVTNSSMVASLSTISNGEFWYRYRNKNEFPTLQKHAALIESELTQYWMQAYNASKFCEYFLPESWQPRTQSGTNHFAGSIVQVQTDSNNYFKSIKLSNTFIPEISIYTENGNSRLPRYQISYKTNGILPTEDSILKEINKNNIQSAQTIFKNNIVFNNIFSELGETFDGFFVEALDSTLGIAKTTYYYGNGGIKWSDLLSKLSPSAPKFELFSGLYVMYYKILKKAFTNSNMSDYESAKREHSEIWRRIYQQFPGIILENKYSNKDATTSEELYILASNTFKDLFKPENSYNISFIDAESLSNYHGQEIMIGDGIKISANEFAHDSTSVLKAASQYLFVTDISYDLRSDANIQLTVNSIKYQDKVIQRLVKLIK